MHRHQTLGENRILHAQEVLAVSIKCKISCKEMEIRIILACENPIEIGIMRHFLPPENKEYVVKFWFSDLSMQGQFDDGKRE